MFSSKGQRLGLGCTEQWASIHIDRRMTAYHVDTWPTSSLVFNEKLVETAASDFYGQNALTVPIAKPVIINAK